MLLLLGGMMTNGFAQGKTDAVIMLDGARKEGKVLGMGANTVKFKYTGEDFEYELPKKQIRKIQFATGRVEEINEAPQTAASGSSPPETRDKDSKDTKASGRATTSNSAITTTNYDTRVALNIYTDQGSTYYAKSRNAIGNSMDSYTGTLDYLIKRTPFGTKSR
jgi:hypothetical protein